MMYVRLPDLQRGFSPTLNQPVDPELWRQGHEGFCRPNSRTTALVIFPSNLIIGFYGNFGKIFQHQSHDIYDFLWNTLKTTVSLPHPQAPLGRHGGHVEHGVRGGPLSPRAETLHRWPVPGLRSRERERVARSTRRETLIECR
jgi:hypothetical protein